MIKFNDTNLTTGFIKQLLHSFNLPIVKVYKNDSDKNDLIEGEIYIKDNYIVKLVKKNNDNLTFKNITPYYFNKKIQNYTKNLKINTLLYDSHTHEYLGEYLRFLRNYKNLDLMSLYNCFSNSLVPETDHSKFMFSLPVNNYKIYMLPVKFNTTYTINISSDVPYELFCGLYNKGYLSKNNETVGSKSLPELSYKFINSSSFEQAFIFKTPERPDDSFYQYETYFKLFIKLPVSNNSTITVLEGNYLNFGNKTYFKENILPVNNESFVNFESFDNDKSNLKDIKLVSSLQLQTLNSNYSHPFADRLLEYISDNAITNIETISQNIAYLQSELIRRYDNSVDIKENGKVIGRTWSGLASVKNQGVWEDKYRYILYDIAKEDFRNGQTIISGQNDILGYLDKDLEMVLSKSNSDYKGKKN